MEKGARALLKAHLPVKDEHPNRRRRTVPWCEAGLVVLWSQKPLPKPPISQRKTKTRKMRVPSVAERETAPRPKGYWVALTAREDPVRPRAQRCLTIRFWMIWSDKLYSKPMVGCGITTTSMRRWGMTMMRVTVGRRLLGGMRLRFPMIDFEWEVL
jgi:hypothetical protein